MTEPDPTPETEPETEPTPETHIPAQPQSARHKAVQIEYMLFDGGEQDLMDVANWVGDAVYMVMTTPGWETLFLRSPSGMPVPVRLGDYVIKGTDGSFSPFAADSFNASYDKL